MRRRDKIVIKTAATRDGYPVKVWQNIKTGDMYPTHWKIQAAQMAVTKRTNAPTRTNP